MATSEHVDVAIVGGGIAGLTAAWELRDLDVVVLESGDRLGGRIRSERRGDYWLNAGAHVFGSPESASGRLLAELEVAAEPVPGRLAAVALNGKIVARGPVESFPFRLPLTVPERVALVRAGLRLRSAVRSYGAIAAPQPGEDPSERQLRMLAFLDDRSFRDFIGPLPDDVAAIFRSTLTRSSGEPDELAAGYGIGYFHLVWNRGEGLSRNIIGGSGVIIDALSRSAGDRARVGTHVTRVETTSDGVRIGYTVDGEQRELSARAAIVATPAYVTREIVKGLPDDTAAALAQKSRATRRRRAGLTFIAAGSKAAGEAAPASDDHAMATAAATTGAAVVTAPVRPVRTAKPARKRSSGPKAGARPTGKRKR